MLKIRPKLKLLISQWNFYYSSANKTPTPTTSTDDIRITSSQYSVEFIEEKSAYIGCTFLHMIYTNK